VSRCLQRTLTLDRPRRSGTRSSQAGGEANQRLLPPRANGKYRPQAEARCDKFGTRKLSSDPGARRWEALGRTEKIYRVLSPGQVACLGFVIFRFARLWPPGDVLGAVDRHPPSHRDVALPTGFYRLQVTLLRDR